MDVFHTFFGVAGTTSSITVFFFLLWLSEWVVMAVHHWYLWWSWWRSDTLWASLIRLWQHSLLCHVQIVDVDICLQFYRYGDNPVSKYNPMFSDSNWLLWKISEKQDDQVGLQVSFCIMEEQIDTWTYCWRNLYWHFWSGLSLLEYPGVKAIDPAYALPVDIIDRIFYGQENGFTDKL